MTGTELAVYIMVNGYSDKNPFYYNEETRKYDLFYMPDEVAAKYNVGRETVIAWYNLNLIDGIKIGNEFLFPKNVEDPRVKFRTSNY